MKKNIVTKVLDTAESTIKHAGKGVDALAKPVRENALKRFPVLFTLLTTFGVVSTLYGFERIINDIPLLHNNPFSLLIIGVGILALTGTLYKKL
jgi:uncharacterized integral membrane protein